MSVAAKGSTTARSATTRPPTPPRWSRRTSDARATSSTKPAARAPAAAGRRAAGATPAGDGGRRLVIVESPAKARKIADYLGSRYIVESSRRPHPRPSARRRRRPRQVQGRAVGAPGRGRRPRLRAPLRRLPGQEVQVSELKEALKEVDELYLATDGDREGEAIAWHLLETLKPKVPVRRMVFHEITEWRSRPRPRTRATSTSDLVDAQETRRILDRLYGYEVSPVLWKKVMPKLSAGRVQSVATRVIVERERERMAFRVRRLLGHRRPAAGDREEGRAGPARFGPR